MFKLQGFSEQGKTTLVITGAAGTITRQVQGSFPSCTVTVYDSGTLNLSAIYSDDIAPPTAKANPFVAAANGTWFFYAPPGHFDVKFSGGGLAAPFTIGDLSAGTGVSGVISYAKASLPTSKTQNAGNLARVTDNFGGLWMDTGVQWVKVLPDLNIKDAPFNAKMDGVADDTAAWTAVKAAAAATGQAISLGQGILLTDNFDLTGDTPIRVYGTQGSYLPATLTKGTIVRCRTACTNFATFSGRFHSLHDICIDGAGLATNVCLLDPSVAIPVSGINFYRCDFIRPVVTTGVCFDATNAGNHEIDHCNWYDCTFHADPTNGAVVCAVGFNIGGSNAFINKMQSCLFFQQTNSVVMTNGCVSLIDCDFIAAVYSCILITSGHDTIRIEDCYTEAACTYFIFHSVTLSNGNKPLIVSGNMVNNVLPSCNFSTGQPVLLQANQFHSTCIIDNTGRYHVVSILNNWDGTANDFTGPGAALVTRISDKVNGIFVTSISDLLTTSTAALGSTTLAAAFGITSALTPTALSGAVNDYNPTGFSATTVIRIDPNGAARNITGFVATSGAVHRLCNISVVGAENLVLKHQDAGSAAGNRIIGPNLADHTIRPGGSADIWYDVTTARWRVLAA